MMKALMKHDVSPDCQLERELYHGTNSTACEAINHQGFNRTFAGKNGTVTIVTFYVIDTLIHHPSTIWKWLGLVSIFLRKPVQMVWDLWGL